MVGLKEGSVIKIIIVVDGAEKFGFEAVIKKELQAKDLKVNELRENIRNIVAAAHAATNSADKLINRLRNENTLLEATVTDLKTELEDLESRIKFLEEGAKEDEF